MLQEKNLSTKNSVPGKTVLQNVEIKIFLDKQKLKEFIASKLALQEMLKRVLPSVRDKERRL